MSSAKLGGFAREIRNLWHHRLASRRCAPPFSARLRRERSFFWVIISEAGSFFFSLKNVLSPCGGGTGPHLGVYYAISKCLWSKKKCNFDEFFLTADPRWGVTAPHLGIKNRFRQLFWGPKPLLFEFFWAKIDRKYLKFWPCIKMGPC